MGYNTQVTVTLINPAVFYHECEYKPYKLLALAKIKEGKVMDIQLKMI